MEEKKNIMDDVEKLVNEQVEPENLDDVDIGLPETTKLDIAVQERFNLASSYQTLKIRYDTSHASAVANKSVGNEAKAKEFEKQAEAINVQMKHCLRGIKVLDKAYPEAKARMISDLSKKK